MAINAYKTDTEGDALLVKFEQPFIYVEKINDVNYQIETESEDLYYYKEFRWSVDGQLFSDWFSFDNDDKSSLGKISMINKMFFIEFRFTQIGDGELTLNDLSLDLDYDPNSPCLNRQKFTCCDANSITQNAITYNGGCCGTFNPYALGNTNKMMMDLSYIISNMFGFCVKYYKTMEDQKSRDVILREYSLYNVIDMKDVKIVIPDNQLPSRDIQFNPLMLDFPAQFEVHIVRSAFEQAFGVGARPQERDYLYFEQYMNRMYEVDAVTQPDDIIFDTAYWRVSLVQYQQRTAVGFDTEELEKSTKDTILSVDDLFKEETDNEFEKVRKKETQYKTIGKGSDDHIRKYLNNNLKINQENIYINYTSVSSYNYELNSIPFNSLGVTYRLKNDISFESGAITFFIKPKIINYPNSKTIHVGKKQDEFSIAIQKPDEFSTQQSLNRIKKGDYIRILENKKRYKVTNVDITPVNYVYTLNKSIDDIKDVENIKIVKQQTTGNFIECDNKLEVNVSQKSMYLRLGDFEKDFTKSRIYNEIKEINFENNEWYAVVINFNNTFKTLSTHIYKVDYANDAQKERQRKFNLIYREVCDGFDSDLVITQKDSLNLLGSNCLLTNLRFWKEPIDDESQTINLSQYVVNDTQLINLVDNATPELLLEKYNGN